MQHVAPVDAVSAGQMGSDHRAQSQRGLPHYPPRAAGNEGEGLGADHQHRVGAQPRRQSRTSRPMSPPSTASPASPRRSRSRRRTSGVTVNCISPGYVWTPLVENQIPDTMRARGLTREQVMNDVLLAAQPTKTVRHRRSGRRARSVPVPRRSERDHRRQSVDGWRLDGAIGDSQSMLAGAKPLADHMARMKRVLAFAVLLSLAAVPAAAPAQAGAEWRGVATADDSAANAASARLRGRRQSALRTVRVTQLT